MSYTIPEATRSQWKKQAQAANMPYATVVGQHIYDLQGLSEVLKQELDQASKVQDTSKVAELSRKLDHTNQQIAAYQQEQDQC